ncbi:hypothetical protein OROHE_003397 [Orobanche hederae]
MLDAITPDTKNWTAKVSVVNKTEPRTSSQPASIRFQKMLLADTKGNRIEAMLYRGDIDLLKNSFQPHQTYLMSNALVRPLKLGFENPLTNNKYQWILGSKTAILATHEDSLTFSELAPTFIHFDQFRDFLGSRALISTTAIIIDSHPPRIVTARGKQNTLREYAAIDDLLRPFIITFWNDTAPDGVYDLLDQVKDRHIIAALNFNVTEYHNISLSSTSASVVLLNSKNERVQALQQWYFMHRREIDDIQHQGDVFGIAQSTFSIDPETFTSIQTFLTAEQVLASKLLVFVVVYNMSTPSMCVVDDISFLCVRGKLLSQIQNLIYPCCTKCHRLTTAEYNCPFECHSCHETKTAIPRYRLSLLIYDQTGEMEVTAFGDEGEKIMRMSAADFLDKYCNATFPTLDSINSNLQQLQLKMKVHSKVFNKQDGTSILSHTIQSVECHQLPSSTINADEINTALPPDIKYAAASDPPQAETSGLPLTDAKPLTSSTKDHPRPDMHTATSSRGRALKTKKIE